MPIQLSNNKKYNLLFLQGPLGSFFNKLAKCFSHCGYTTHRIHFNAGDRFYGGADNSVDYTGKPERWLPFIRSYLKNNNISAVFLMGDCRYYHHMTKIICAELGVAVYVFEEGYLRPNTITLERHGVNAFSALPLDSRTLAQITPHKCLSAISIKSTMWERFIAASLYYWTAYLSSYQFPYYRHHRSFNPVVEGTKWLKGFARKQLYKKRDRTIEYRLRQELSKQFYLVALQVHDDSQLIYHSPYASVEQFITETMQSFADHASGDTILVIKHHPMDRGYTHHGQIISNTAKTLGIEHRVIYCHDIRLPKTYNHCLGVVTVNSTVGPSALLHNIPVKTMGTAMYDMPGLTSQCSLDDFWQNPEPVDSLLFQQFQTCLFDKTQINGSFFSHLSMTCENILAFYESELRPQETAGNPSPQAPDNAIQGSVQTSTPPVKKPIPKPQVA